MASSALSAKLADNKTVTVTPDEYDDPGEQLKPLKDYARRVMPEAFKNLDEVLVPLFATKPAGHMFDVTVFYSQRNELVSAENDALLSHNQHAFDGARRMGGLLIYFQGPLLEFGKKHRQLDERLKFEFEPDCMSFCIWESLKHAKTGASASDHKAAAEGAARWYRGFAIEKLDATLKIVNGRQTVTFKHPEDLFEADFA
jgi:hypothetical protein